LRPVALRPRLSAGLPLSPQAQAVSNQRRLRSGFPQAWPFKHDMSSSESVALWSQRLPAAPAGAVHRLQADIDIALGRRPGRYADAHRSAAVPRSAAAPTDTIVLYHFYDAIGPLASTKRHQHLVEHHLVQDFVSGSPQTVGKLRGEPASPLDLIADAPASEVAQRRPQLDRARPPRGIRAPAHGVPSRGLTVVGSGDCHGLSQRLALADDGDTAVLW